MANKRLVGAWLLGLLTCLPVARGAGDSEVVFSEDFERFEAGNWNTVRKTVVIVDGGRRGKCAQVTATLGEDTGGYLYKMLKPGLDKGHVRFYVKFEKEHGYTHHFVTLMGYNPPTPWPQGGAGDRPRGDERFSTGIEPWGNWGAYAPPGVWHFYSYFCDMKPSPDGRYWGNSYRPDPPVAVARDQWICVEIMLKCNSAPDKSDGEQALWIDGREVGRFTGIRWRKDEKLKISGLSVESYITEQASRHNKVQNPRKVNRVWFDDIVVSRSYIGPAKN